MYRTHQTQKTGFFNIRNFEKKNIHNQLINPLKSPEIPVAIQLTSFGGSPVVLPQKLPYKIATMGHQNPREKRSRGHMLFAKVP